MSDMFDELLFGSSGEEEQSSLTDLNPRTLVTTKAQEYGVPVELALALTNQESGFDNSATSPKGARGLMQLMPGTAAELGVDPNDPVQNVDGGMRYLRQQFDEFGSWDLALAAYHAGPGNVRKFGGIPDTNDGLIETRKYVDSIMSRANRQGGVEQSAPQGQDEFDAMLFGGGRKQASDEGLWAVDDFMSQSVNKAQTDGPKYGKLPNIVSKGLAQMVRGVGWITGEEDIERIGKERVEAIVADQMKDPEMADALSKYGDAKGLIDTLSVFKDEPLALADIVISSATNILASYGVAATIGRVPGMPAALGLVARLGASIGMSGGSIAAATAATQRGFATLAAAGTEAALTAGSAGSEIEEKLLKQGKSQEEARAAANAAALQIGVATALLSGLGDAALVGRVASGAGVKAGAGELAKDLVVRPTLEGVQEVVEEERTTSATGEEFDPGKAFAGGFAASAATSAGLHGVGRLQERMANAATPELTDRIETQPTTQPQDPRPEQKITPVGETVDISGIMNAQSVDEAIARFMSMPKIEAPKGVDFDTLSSAQIIAQVADTQALRVAMEQMSPESRDSLMRSIDTVRNGDPRVPNAARVQATNEAMEALRASGALEQAQFEVQQKAMAGSLEERSTIEQARTLTESQQFAQLVANVPDNLKQAIQVSAAQMNNTSIPEAERAIHAKRLTDFATKAGVVQESAAPAQAQKAEKVDQPKATADSFSANRAAVQQVTSSAQWKAALDAMPKEQRAQVIDQVAQVSNIKLPASSRNNAAVAVLAAADQAGVGIPTLRGEIAPLSPSGAGRGISVADAQTALSKARFRPEDGVVKLADMNVRRADSVSDQEARLAQVMARAFGKEIVFFEQEGNTVQRDGFVLPEAKNLVFVNRNQSGSASVAAVAMHEIGHKMPKEVLQKFMGVVDSSLKQGAYDQYRDASGQPELDNEATLEEISVDLWANGFRNPELIKQALSDMPVSAAQKLLNTVREVIAKMIQQVGAMAGFDTTALVADMKAVDDAWVSAFRDYIAAENEGRGTIGGRSADTFSMEELAELMADKENPLSEKAEAEYQRRSTYPDYDAVDQLASKTGKKDWKGWPQAAEKKAEEAKPLVSLKDRMMAQLEARRKRDRGELLNSLEFEAANAPDIQKNPDAKIEVVEERKRKPRADGGDGGTGSVAKPATKESAPAAAKGAAPNVSLKVKRAADFSETGNYEVDVGETKAVIFRDTNTGWWYEEKNGRASDHPLGFTKQEAIEKLQGRELIRLAREAEDADDAITEDEANAELEDEEYNEDPTLNPKYSTRRKDFTDPEQRREVSTAKPMGKKATVNSYTDKLVIDREDITSSQKHIDAIGEALAKYDTLSGQGDGKALMKELHDTVVSNLLWLHDKVPPQIRERAKKWYDGANTIANDWTKKYGVTERQASGVLAVLSPQMDWFKNVSLAERVMHIWQNRQDTVWTPAMTRWTETWFENAYDEDTIARRQEVLNDARRLEGTPLFEMDEADAARFIRVFDETYQDKSYRLVTPEGGFGENVTNADDGEAGVTWPGFDTIEKAISILNDGSFRNIDEKLGTNHKVRNFYNNIINPNSADGHVTIDTHAVAAALMKPVTGNSIEVQENFGKVAKNSMTGSMGTYALFADAYRDAAAKRGVLAREMQSITWEAVRAMFPWAQKRVLTPQVNEIWNQFREGKLTRNEARRKVAAISGDPGKVSWDTTGAGVRAADGAMSFNAPATVDPNVGRTMATTTRVGLSASTASIPGLEQLTTLANKGDAAAHALLQDVAVDSLRHLLSGTDAKVKFDRATGLFEGAAEPSLGVSINFTDDQRPAVLAALAKFAQNFNQKQIHVRRATSDNIGTVYDDGSYATPVYRWNLPKALSRRQVQQIIDTSGLYGLTFGDDFVEAYYVGDPENEADLNEFSSNIQKAAQQIGKHGGTLELGTQRLWAYGDGEGVIGYERIAGDLPGVEQAASVETARRIANYLNGGERVRAFDQAATITEEQDALQTKIAQAFDQAPVNDLKNPTVRKAYTELKKETIRQFNTLPVKVEVFTGKGEPYKNSDAMRRDILDNNHLYIYATTPETFGPAGQDFSKHPLLEQTGIKDINGYPMVANDLFRAIHDYFAHGMSQTQFGPKGEEAAWKNHMAATNNPWARWALTMETRGQNSWVNFRPDLDRKTPVKDRPFAEQKAALLPVEYTLTGDSKTDRLMKDFIKNLPPSQRNGSLRDGVKYSSARTAIQPTWQAEDPSKMDDFIYTMQDKNVDLKRAISSIKETGARIVDQFNPYLKEELYHGRAAKRTKDFLDHEMKPLMQSMQAAKVDIAELNEYLHMRHAPERNAQIAKINPKMPDGGSGVKTADALAYMAGLDPQKKRTLAALARRVDAITKATRDMMVADNLEGQGTINEWESTYQHYVPLMREDVGTGGLGAGQGFSVKGVSSKRAMGSDKPVADILANIAMMREKTVTRIEKARVSNALLGLAIQNPNTEFWMPVIPGRDVQKQQTALLDMGLDPALVNNLVNQPVKRYIDPRTGLVREMVDNSLGNNPNVIATRFQGKDYYLVMNPQNERAMRMARSLKGLDGQQLGVVLGNVQKVTRWFAAVNTQYNPIFGILNLTRDTGGSMLNLTSTQIAGKQAEVAGNIAPALKGIYSSLRQSRKGGQSRGQWAQLWEEFQDAGGRTGFRDMFATSEDRAKALQAEFDALNAGGAKMIGRAVMGWLSDFNDTLENAVRLSAYKVAKEQGISNEQAASLAKNLTVNFNRKGEIATQAGALYAFFNASMQGSARLFETMRGPAGKKIAMGGILLGVVQSLALAAAGIDDDEIPEFVKQRNIVIPTGGGKFISVPMPLGFNVLPSIGRLATDFVRGGGKTPTKYVGAMVDLLADNFNPIGNAGLSVQTISPTFADPLVALSENKDWTGKPIAKEDRSSLSPTPGHTRAKQTASAPSKWLSEAINTVTGGTDAKPGMLSPTPDQIDFLIGQITGGIGREVLKASEVAESAVTGEELPSNKVPLLGRFVGNVNEQAVTSSKFYQNVTDLNLHEAELKTLKGSEKAAYLRDNPEASLVKEANSIEKEISSLRKMKKRLIDSGAPKERVRAIDQRITSQMDRLNRKVESKQ